MVRQVGQSYRSGRLSLEEVAYPSLRASGVIIKTAFSVISMGTEGMKVREARMNYLEKARARPDQLKQVLDSVRQQGVRATYQKVMNRLEQLSPLGYSLSGYVVEVGEDVTDFHIGQRVAAAGAEFANHGEYNFVPHNLVAPIPEGVSMEHAAFGTIGAIATHAFRQSRAALGEVVLVVGLGLVGQLLVRILHAAGVRVVGVDLMPDRCELARTGGAAAVSAPDDAGWRHAIDRLSAGHGADAVLIAAGSPSNTLIELSASAVRNGGRVVVVGKTKLDLDYNTFFRKEAEVVFSRSYGPGRYDPSYEIEGSDYPYQYVRWTERRNIEAFLELLAARRIDIAPLVNLVRDFDHAADVYDSIDAGETNAIGILLDYGVRSPDGQRPPLMVVRSQAEETRPVVIGALGAGNYASSMLLPHLKADPRVRLDAIVTTTGLSAAGAAQRFDIARHGTDANAVLHDPDIRGVLIATRHRTHAKFAAEALRVGKTVFVEKPLAIDLDGVAEVEAAIRKSGNARLMVGFNRRFAPAISEIAAHFSGKGPLTMLYRVRADALPDDAWQRSRAEGGQFAGEAGHFFDVFQFLTASAPVTVSAARLAPAAGMAEDHDNLTVTVSYADGSTGTLIYATQGGAQVGKEYLEVHGAGLSAVLHNFASLQLFGPGQRAVKRNGLGGDKGQRAQMRRFVDLIEKSDAPPTPLEALLDTTRLTLLAVEAAISRQTLSLR